MESIIEVPKIMKYYPFEIITFLDHHHINDTWVKPEDIKIQSVLLQYVGWVVKEDKKCVMLAQGRDLAAEHREEIAIVFEQTGALSTRTYKAVQHQKKEVERTLQEILKEGVEQGDFAIDDVRLASFAILGLCNWTYHWYRSGGEFTSEQIADTYIDLLEKGYIK